MKHLIRIMSCDRMFSSLVLTFLHRVCLAIYYIKIKLSVLIKHKTKYKKERKNVLNHEQFNPDYITV